MRVMDASTLLPIGYLTEISAIGIQVDSEKPLPLNAAFKLRLDLTADIANKTNLVFNARSKWCEPDRMIPNSYNRKVWISRGRVGFPHFFPEIKRPLTWGTLSREAWIFPFRGWESRAGIPAHYRRAGIVRT